MSDFNWDSFASGDFIKFKQVGDTATGEIIAVGLGTDFQGNPCPKITLRCDDGEDRVVNAGQKVLQSRLAEVRPQVGERVAIVLDGFGQAQPGKEPAKLFTVQVRSTDGQLRQAPETGVEQPTPTPASAAAPAVAQPSASSLV